MNREKRQQGFTITELMITVGIIGIALSIGVPSMVTMIATNKISAQSRSVVTAFNYARSEAVTRKEEVTVMPTNGTDWSEGLTVWTDADESGAMNNNDDEVLQVYQELDSSSLIPALVTVNQVTFNRDGAMIRPAEEVQFELQLDDCQVDGRTITVSLNGRVDVDFSVCP